MLKQRLSYIFKTTQHNGLKKLHDVSDDSHFKLDEITCNDLGLDDINLELNNNQTTFGSELFEHWLKSIKSLNDLTTIQQDTKTLLDSDKRNDIERRLKKVGKQYRGHIISDLWNGFEIDSFIIKNLFILLLINLTLFITLSLLIPKMVILWILIFMVSNLIIYLNTNPIISQYSGSINYILAGVILLNKIKKGKLDLLSPNLPSFEQFKYLQWCTLLFRDGIASANSETPVSLLLDYVRIFLNFEAISFKITYNIILKNISNIREIIYFIGYYDCILNNVSIIENYVTTFAEYNNDGELNFTDIYHPLLTDPVKQSAQINSGLIITGLNMAGKSTFMKTVALNQLFATSLGICFANNMSSDIFKIITSFRINDALLENKSRYFAEAERIASIIKNVSEGKCLCFIDEILSGTNSKDRIYGSVEILKQLSVTEKSIIISATHDLEIANNLKGIYELGYFDGRIENENLIFDYILKPGVVSDRNGLLILEVLGINI